MVPVDALSYHYNIMNERAFNIGNNRNKCNFGMFEIMSNLYGEGYADCIYIRNALDHCWDPYLGIIKCLHTLKVGGVMKLSHRRAEAVYENWEGLHQWNMDCIDGDFVIWNKGNAVNVSEAIMEYAEITTNIVEENSFNIPWVNVIIKKSKRLDMGRFVDAETENQILAKFVSILMKKNATDGSCFLSIMEKMGI